MDIVVEKIAPKYGMLLSRSWGAKLQGTLQMDMTYGTIPVFGQQRRLYRETLINYMVSSQEKPNNYPLYYVNSNLNSFILHNDESVEDEVSHLEDELSKTLEMKLEPAKLEEEGESLWNMEFYGDVRKEGAGAGVWILKSQIGITKGHSYKLNFQGTNNISKYEALILRLQLLKRLGEKIIYVHGDLEIIIN